MTPGDLAATLATFRANYGAIPAAVRQLLPAANLFVLNYFNPFPANPGNPAGPVAAVGGPMLNDIIRQLAAQNGGITVDTFTPYVGREAALTCIDDLPAVFVQPSPFGGVEPLGHVHPNAAGYQVIASRLIAVSPAPPPGLLAFGAGGRADEGAAESSVGRVAQ